MEQDSIKQMMEQHIKNYKKSIIDIIENNTKALVYDDIMSIIGKPPLDSMDLIRSKLLDLAKKNKIVLNMEHLSKILDSYRKSLVKCCDDISKYRKDELIKKVNSFDVHDREVLIFYKKDFININKKIRNIMKDSLNMSFEKGILNHISSLFSSLVDDSIKDKIINDLSKYFKSNYQKQILESLDIKVLVKDTTLINSIKEQSDRYLFTLDNSRLFNS